jgi:tetratricopeptide (TPR) repeat protein
MQYIPALDTPENNGLAERAIKHYQHVLDSDAVHNDKINSAKGIPYLYLNMKEFEDSKKYYRMVSDLDPKDPEPHYYIGVIDWAMCYKPRMEERAKLGVKPEEALNPTDQDQRKVCDELKVKSTPILEEGIDNLNQAIQLRPDYDDARAYMNLIYREKADVECDDPTAREEDLKTADDWVDKLLAGKKAKSEKPPVQRSDQKQ